MANSTTLFLPIEVGARELDCRLLCAAYCVRSSRRVLLGQHDRVFQMVMRSRGGIYLGKNVFRSLFPSSANIRRYATLKSRRHNLLHLDEEGAIFRGNSPELWRNELDRRLDASLMTPDDFVCTWGNFQRDHYRQAAPALADQIQTTGHPRFDLYKPPYRRYFDSEVAQLRKAYAPYILVNTHLTTANPALGFSHVFSGALQYESATPHGRESGLRRWVYETEKLAGLVTLCQYLSSHLPDVRIVLRPHPAERLDLYHAMFAEASNVVVTRQGSVTPWILGAAAVVHSGCTTALEAILAHIPVVTYSSPTPDPQIDPGLVMHCGTACAAPDEALALLGRLLESDSPDPGESDIPGRAERSHDTLLMNFSAESLPVLDRLITRVENDSHSRSHTLPSRRYMRAYAAGVLADNAMRSAARLAAPRRRHLHAVRQDIFSGFDRDEIDDKLARAGALLNTRFETIHFGPSLVLLESD